MSRNRPRQDRKSVRISVRVRTDAGWIDATIRNVSDRGLMLHSVEPLRASQQVEIARGRHRVAGRIVWNNASVSGLRASESVDLHGLLAHDDASQDAGLVDRRTRSREEVAAGAASIGERVAASRTMTRAVEYAFLLVAACVAIIAAISLHESFSTPEGKLRLLAAEHARMIPPPR